MGAVYGVGLPGFLPQMTEDEQQDTMTRFASLCGLTIPFREIIGTRVGEWRPPETQEGSYTMRWLDDTEAEPILTIARQERGGGPYSLMTFLDDWHVLVPGSYSPRQSIQLPLPDNSTYPLRIRTLQQGIRGIQAINRRIKKYDDAWWQDMRFSCEEYLQFHRTLSAAFKRCVQHSLIYVLGE